VHAVQDPVQCIPICITVYSISIAVWCSINFCAVQFSPGFISVNIRPSCSVFPYQLQLSALSVAVLCKAVPVGVQSMHICNAVLCNYSFSAVKPQLHCSTTLQYSAGSFRVLCSPTCSAAQSQLQSNLQCSAIPAAAQCRPSCNIVQ
jgi:hypothetical protein